MEYIHLKCCSFPDRGVLVVGEEGYDRVWGEFSDDIKCLEVSLRNSNNYLQMKVWSSLF